MGLNCAPKPAHSKTSRRRVQGGIIATILVLAYPLMVHALRRASGPPSQSVLGSLGKTMRDAVRNKGRWKRRRTPTQYSSTS